jgi:hypothetical protein
MWSWLIVKKNITHVMYIAILRDGSKRVMKLSKWFGKGFEIGVMEERENGLTQKRIDVEMFFSSIKIDPSPHVRLLELIFLSFSTLIFFLHLFSFLLHLFIRGWTWGLLKIFKEKTKLYTMNMKWWSCGYISGGRIFRDGVMHANIFDWGLQQNFTNEKSIKKLKLEKNTSLNKAQQEQ